MLCFQCVFIDGDAVKLNRVVDVDTPAAGSGPPGTHHLVEDHLIIQGRKPVLGGIDI